MAENETGAPAGSEEFVSHKAGGEGPLSVREAGRSLSDWRSKLNASTAPPPDKQPEAAAEAPAAEESADEADATSPETEPNREMDEPDLDESPLIEPPPSWTAEQRERWSKLDTATKEYLVEYDKQTSSAVSRAQKEAAEQLKGLSAREQAMEQARLQFEAATQAALQSLQSQLQGEFSDIQTMEDVKKLANDDWARYLRWDAHQKDIAAKMSAVREAQQRQAGEEQSKFAKFADEQDKHFIERVPEFADKEKAAKLQSAAIDTLKRVGFAEDELTKFWNGQDKPFLRDARMQELIHKAARWDEAQAAKKTVSAKPLPPVQRPGVAQPKQGLHSQISTLQKQLNSATGLQALRIGTQLTRLQREAGNLR